jgi:hypothetical protein
MKSTTCIVALIVLVAIPIRVRAEGAGGTVASLASARELYASAAYDDALAMLNGLESGAKAQDERQSIDLYRALCLVALGRTSDADHAIEAMVQRDPLYHASADDLSPRLQSTFDEVRKRMLPSIIQKEYADAKVAFDKQEFAIAAAGFDSVLKGIADPGISAIAAAPPLSDLRTLATGFRDLSVKFTPPPPLPVVVPEAKPVRQLRSLYTSEDASVVAPVAIDQKVPRFPSAVVKPATGLVEIVIDESGAVQSAVMRMSIDPNYDKMVLAAAAKWQYHPATVDGVPVKFMKRLSISVSSTAP